MAGELEELKAILSVGDLARYIENDILLNHALSYAASEINHRRGSVRQTGGLSYEPQYRSNVINGAIWWLGKIGAEGYSATSENGVSVTWREIPEWLQSVIPRLGLGR